LFILIKTIRVVEKKRRWNAFGGYLYGFRLPSLRDCAGMTEVVFWFSSEIVCVRWFDIFFMVLNHEEDTGAGTPRLYVGGLRLGGGWLR